MKKIYNLNSITENDFWGWMWKGLGSLGEEVCVCNPDYKNRILIYHINNSTVVFKYINLPARMIVFSETEEKCNKVVDDLSAFLKNHCPENKKYLLDRIEGF